MSRQRCPRRQQLAIGARVEMEHTKSRRVARRIASDHLREDPCYYKKLCRTFPGDSGCSRRR